LITQGFVFHQGCPHGRLRAGGRSHARGAALGWAGRGTTGRATGPAICGQAAEEDASRRRAGRMWAGWYVLDNYFYNLNQELACYLSLRFYSRIDTWNSGHSSPLIFQVPFETLHSMFEIILSNFPLPIHIHTLLRPQNLP
jgi:hypothetical protein